MENGSLNLTVARGEKSVWDSPALSSRLADLDRERLIALAWGSTLAAVGLRRGGLGGAALATLGSVFAVRAAMGRHDIQCLRTRVDTMLKEHGWRRRDVVQDASEESFPASDSPGWTGKKG